LFLLFLTLFEEISQN